MKNTAILKFVMLVMIGVGVIGLSGCNTMQGFGRDIEHAGEAIQRKAR